ncbi:hypothetical protein Syun_005711 [Stephania yunnanensis]|uniref:GTP-eEF1A C-terminal domain-containing protein n=1 Tax=Stephania yunnanensis TaxID=152371 RepID=A0AAP0L8Y6_9MAGN
MLAEKHVGVVSEFDAQLQIIELLDNAIFTAGYKAALHIHSVVEECEIVKLLQQIGPKTKKPMKKKLEIFRRKVRKDWYVGLHSDLVDRSLPDVHDESLIKEGSTTESMSNGGSSDSNPDAKDGIHVATVENDEDLEADADSSFELFRDNDERADEYNYDYDDYIDESMWGDEE